MEPAYGGMLLLNGVTFWMYLQVPALTFYTPYHHV
jgi:hypothetical protein